MPTTDQRAYTRAVDALAKAVTKGAAKRSRWARDLRHLERADYARLIHAGDWTGLGRYADELLGRARADFDAACAEHAQLSARVEAAEVASTARAALPRPDTLPDWPAVRAAITTGLRARGVAADRAEILADTAGARPPADAADDLVRAVHEELDRLDAAATALLASVSGARLARAVATLNSPGSGPRRGRADAERWCGKVERDLLTRDGRLRAAWAAGDRAGAAHRATALRDYADAEQERGAELVAASAARRTQADDPAEDAVAIRIGAALRALLSVAAVADLARYAAADAVGLDRQALPRREVSRRWVQAARRTDEDVPDPPERSVTDVTDGTVPAGETVTVRGTIGVVTVEHRFGKAVSTTNLTDADGKTLPVALSHIKLDSGGLAPGTAATITGGWRRNVGWLDGRDAFVVARQKTDRLARRSWPAWLAAAARDSWTATPHGLAVRASWQPGIDGAGNPLRFGVWHDVH